MIRIDTTEANSVKVANEKYPLNGFLIASAYESDRVDVIERITRRAIVKGVIYSSFIDASTSLPMGANQSATITALNNAFDASGLTGIDVEDLDDVTLTSLANNQVLAYNSTLSKWVNVAQSGGGADNMIQTFSAPTNTGEFQDGARLVADAYGTSPSATAGTVVNFAASNVSAVGAQSAAAAATGMLGVVTDAGDGDEVLVEGVIKLSTATTTTLLPTTTKMGAPVYMSTTAGAVTNTAPTTAGEFVRIVGHVVDASNRTIYFKPDNTWLEL